MSPFCFLWPTLLFALLTCAASIPSLVNRASITALSSSQISSYTPFANFASAAYCKPSAIANWACGVNCNANSCFQVEATGGDGGAVQYWYVGYSPSLGTVVVAHEGTQTSQILADITDIDIALKPLSSSLFPGLSSSIEVHSGFQDEQAKTAQAILAAVKSALAKHKVNSITTVGHSLGGALSLLDGLYLSLQLKSTSIRVVTFGMPRVGNKAFATYIDAHVPLTHINNKEDPIPILPGRFLGFAHPAGEVHITDSNVWEACPGQDNTSKLCIVGDVPTIFQGDESDHDGPYNGVTIGC